jgi:hypothetical protein
MTRGNMETILARQVLTDQGAFQLALGMKLDRQEEFLWSDGKYPLPWDA